MSSYKIVNGQIRDAKEFNGKVRLGKGIKFGSDVLVNRG